MQNVLMRDLPSMEYIYLENNIKWHLGGHEDVR